MYLYIYFEVYTVYIYIFFLDYQPSTKLCSVTTASTLKRYCYWIKTCNPQTEGSGLSFDEEEMRAEPQKSPASLEIL